MRKKKRFRPFTRGMKLDRGQKYDRKKDFGENGWFGSREKREILRYLSSKLLGSKCLEQLANHEYKLV